MELLLDVHLVTDRMTGRSRGFAFCDHEQRLLKAKRRISALEGKKKNLDGPQSYRQRRPARKDEGGEALFF